MKIPTKCKFFWTEKGCRNGIECPYRHEETEDSESEYKNRYNHTNRHNHTNTHNQSQIKIWFLLNNLSCKRAKIYSRNLKNKMNEDIYYVSVTDNSYIMSKEEHDQNQEYAFGKCELSEDIEEIEYRYVLICGKNKEIIEDCLNDILNTEIHESFYDSDTDTDTDYARIRTDDGEVSEYGKSKGILYVI